VSEVVDSVINGLLFIKFLTVPDTINLILNS
jgi:hypothetical protein